MTSSVSHGLYNVDGRNMRNGKALEGSDHGLIQELPIIYMENWEKPRKTESGHKIFDTGGRA